MKKFLSILTLVALSACAHAPLEHVVDQKLATEAQVENSDQLSLKAEREIKNSPSLNDDQKNQLLDLRYKTHEELTKLQQESLKLRDLLITDFTQPVTSSNEIEIIKNRLKKVEQKRLVVMFSAIDQATLILGPKNPVNYRILRNFGDFPPLIR